MKMAEAQWGGKRTPHNPAPVSAPGALSRRTDGGPQQTNPRMSGMPYGENQDFEDMQSAAPMAASRSAGRASGGARAKAPQGPSATPLFSPTGRPEEPITAGASFGPGETPAGNSFNTDYDDDMSRIKQYLPDLETAMKFPNTPKTFIALVNYLKNI